LKAINSALGRTAGLGGEEPTLNPHAPSVESQKRFRDWFRLRGDAIGSTAVDIWIRELEAASTDHLSALQLEAIGSRRVTAFTVGVPYNFVNRGTYNWQDKPIGYLINDKSLALLTELWSAKENSEHSYTCVSLIFDPGYFATQEANNVDRELRRHH
jgi:hypothetical protein